MKLQLLDVVQMVLETKVWTVWVPNGCLLFPTVMMTVSRTIDVTVPKTSSEQILGGGLVLMLSNGFPVAVAPVLEVTFGDVVMVLSDITLVVIVSELGVDVGMTLLSVQVTAGEVVPTVFVKGTPADMH